jgi:FixJ family two-component response regulator
MAIRSKRQVLVVDDDPNVRDSVARLLMSAGYDVASRRMASQLFPT